MDNFNVSVITLLAGEAHIYDFPGPTKFFLIDNYGPAAIEVFLKSGGSFGLKSVVLPAHQSLRVSGVTDQIKFLSAQRGKVRVLSAS